MLAEKDDWVPRNVAPFMWRNQEGNIDQSTAGAASSPVISEAKAKSEATKGTSIDVPDSKHKTPKASDHIERPKTISSISSMPTAGHPSLSTHNNMSLQELSTPLLTNEQSIKACQKVSDDLPPSPSRSLALFDTNNNGSEEDDSKTKKMGRKARMLDLGKKMGEKLEEKRRNLEEKSRLIVEKMRENKKS